MNKVELLEALQPTEAELDDLKRCFAYHPAGPLDALDLAPYLILVRRAVQHGFYTDAVEPAAT